jgi:hypothetical protein
MVLLQHHREGLDGRELLGHCDVQSIGRFNLFLAALSC